MIVRSPAFAAPLGALHDVEPRDGGEVLVVGSGKGGVGKSTIAVRLAASLAARGERTLLCDGTQHRGHLHVLLGVRAPALLERTLLKGGDLERLAARVAGDLWLLPSASGSPRLAALGPVERAEVHYRVSRVFGRYAHTVLDADGGVDGVVRAVTMHPSRLLLVVTPEPTALADAYALAKVALQRCPSLGVDVIVNRASGAAEGESAFGRLEQAAERFLGRTFRHLATLPDDPAVGRAVRRPGGLLALPGRDFEPLVRALFAREDAGEKERAS